MNYLFKFFLIIFIVFIIKNICSQDENYKNIEVQNNKINNKYDILFSNNYSYNYTNINDTTIYTLYNMILKDAMKDPILYKKIDDMILTIYEESKHNHNLKFYLKFLNLMNDDNMLFFKDFSKEEYMITKIKVLLFLVPPKELEKLLSNSY
jgi:hypothetical protein